MTGDDLKRQYMPDLIVLLSRISFNDKERIRAEELCQKITNWSLFTNLAIKNGLAALIRQNLIDLGLNRFLPEAENKILETLWLKTIARVSYLNSIASEIAGLLEKEGIRALLLKGLAFEHTLYGSRGLRQMSDADILVSHSEVLRARDILESAGFVSRQMKSGFYRKILLEMGNHLPELERNGVSVDLHYRLFGMRIEPLTEEALKKPYQFSKGGRTYYTLPALITFLSLVKHLQKHEVKGEFQLRLYSDIYLILLNHREEVLCDRLKVAAISLGIEDNVKKVLIVMKYLYDLDVPGELIIDVSDISMIVESFRCKILDPVLAGPSDSRQTYYQIFRSLKGTRNRMIFIAGDIWPSFAFMKKRYGVRTALGCLIYYPHRVGKLLWAAEAWLRE